MYTRRILLAGLVVTAILFAVQCTQILRFPYECEFGEGAEYLAAARISRGESCYGWPRSAVYPSADYAYPPVYPALCGTIYRLVGPARSGLWINRTVSILSAIAITAISFLAVFGRTHKRAPALIAGLFILSAEPFHRFLDIGRPDAFGLCIALVALCVVGLRSRRARSLFVPLALLAALTKQTFIAAGIVGIVYTWGRDRREAVQQAVALALLLAVSIGVLTAVTRGDFLDNVFRYQSLVQSDTIYPPRSPLISVSNYVSRLLIWTLVPQVISLWYVRRRWKARYELGEQWMLAYVIITPLTVLSIIHWGAFTNRLIPGVAVVGILFGFGLAEMETIWRQRAAQQLPRLGWIAATPLLALVHLCTNSTFTEQVQDLPQEADEMQRLSDLCKRASGPVLSEVPRYAICSVRPDALTHLGLMKPQIGQGGRQLAALDRDIEANRFAMIIVYSGLGTAPTYLPPDIYRHVERRYTRSSVLPLTGFEVYERRASIAQSANSLTK